MQLKILILILIFSVLLPRKLPTEIKQQNFDYPSSTLSKIGDNPSPGNPMNDRAKGYLLDGKIKSSILNYGNFIDWDYNPSGGWGQYTYLPNVSFMAGVPGFITLSEFSCEYRLMRT